MPKITIIRSEKFTDDLRSFGYYDYKNKIIVINFHKRNFADSFRTLAHELVHHKQNCENRLDVNSGKDGSDIENEANSQAGVILRKYGKINSEIYKMTW